MRREIHAGSSPEHGEPFGEKNLLVYTENFSHAPWTIDGSATLIPHVGLVLPGGPTSGANNLVESIVNGGHGVFQYGQVVSGPAAVYTASIFAKAGTRSWLAVNLGNDAGPSENAFFDLTNGVKGAVTGAATSSMVSMGGGVYRCSITLTLLMDGHGFVEVYPTTGDSGPFAYVGVPAAVALLVNGAQLEKGAAATAYAPRLAA